MAIFGQRTRAGTTRDTGPPALTAGTGAAARLVIVGGGMTSQRLVERLVDSGVSRGLEITVLSDEQHPPYDRVALGDVLRERDPASLALRGADWFEDHGVRLALKQRVLRIDREQRRIRTSSGNELSYDKLVLATGGFPVRPPVPGIEQPGVVTYRNLDDVSRIAAAAQPAARIVVLGGGLLGLEAARALQLRGCAVDVVEAAPRLLPRQLDVEGAEVLATQIRALGLRLHLLTRARAVESGDGSFAVELDSGKRLPADLVVVAAGVRPCDGLARDAGLDCHSGGGVLVDDTLTTSDPAIHAVGECARHRDEAYGFVAPCYAMADVLAARFAGDDQHFEGAVPSARLKLDEVDVVAVGESLAEGSGVSALAWSENDSYRRIVLREGRMVGAISVGPDPHFPRIQQAVAEGSFVRAWQRRRFGREGRLWATGRSVPVAHWPDAAVLCTCTGTTCGTLRSAQEGGARTSLALSQCTGAGTVCGSCKPLVAELAGEMTEGRRDSAGAKLGAVAAAALILLAAAAWLGPVPPADSIEVGLGIDVLWRDATWKQVTGFGLVGLSLVSLLFSLRKRSARFSMGSFSAWRFAHTALGLGTIGALGLHTGFRLGANLNLALMLCFASVVAIGALAAGVTSLEHRLPARPAAWLRRGWTTAHVFVAWPLPVLIAFHVLSVYYY